MGYRHIHSDEWDKQLDQPGDGRLQQILITYQRKAGKITKKTVTRCYFKNNQYVDSVTTEVLDIE